MKGIPDEIESRGALTLTWNRAVVTDKCFFPYPGGVMKVLPKGTCGYALQGGPYATFVTDNPGPDFETWCSGFSIQESKLAIDYNECVIIVYDPRISDHGAAELALPSGEDSMTDLSTRLRALDIEPGEAVEAYATLRHRVSHAECMSPRSLVAAKADAALSELLTALEETTAELHELRIKRDNELMRLQRAEAANSQLSEKLTQVDTERQRAEAERDELLARIEALEAELADREARPMQERAIKAEEELSWTKAELAAERGKHPVCRICGGTGRNPHGPDSWLQCWLCRGHGFVCTHKQPAEQAADAGRRVVHEFGEALDRFGKEEPWPQEAGVWDGSETAEEEAEQGGEG